MSSQFIIPTAQTVTTPSSRLYTECVTNSLPGLLKLCNITEKTETTFAQRNSLCINVSWLSWCIFRKQSRLFTIPLLMAQIPLYFELCLHIVCSGQPELQEDLFFSNYGDENEKFKIRNSLHEQTYENRTSDRKKQRLSG